MNVLMVCSEFAPLAKTGGLADAVTGLSNALAARGHDVRVLLPRYAKLPQSPTPLVAVGTPYRFHELPGPSTAPRVYLLDLAELTGLGVYAGDDTDAGRFMRLSAAAPALCAALGWRPDVVHCHDWHAALTPTQVQLRSPQQPLPPTILTLHNVGYQGIFPETVLEEFAMPELRPALPPETYGGGNVNFLRAGAKAADVVTTVSPTYAEEIRTPAFGMGLEDIFAARADAIVGILNGVDYDVWGPTHDPFIDARYDATNLAPKYRLKGALSVRLGLVPDQNAPLVGVVSRLASQKGIDLVTAALPTLLAETRANFVFLASGDADLAVALRQLADAHPRRVSFTEAYNEQLAHQIFAGCDITLVPSRYEPCGLTQMYALRYGTIPVVRATGGLADTIRHFEPRTGMGNGSVFRDADVQGLLWGVRCALGWFDDPTAWLRLVANAMACDFSWDKQVRQYEKLYRDLSAR
jgi:starch synthase